MRVLLGTGLMAALSASAGLHARPAVAAPVTPPEGAQAAYRSSSCAAAPLWRIGYRIYLRGPEGEVAMQASRLASLQAEADSFAERTAEYSLCGVRLQVDLFMESGAWADEFPADANVFKHSRSYDSVFYLYPSNTTEFLGQASVSRGMARFPLPTSTDVTRVPALGLLMHEWLHLVVYHYRHVTWPAGDVHGQSGHPAYPLTYQGGLDYFRDMLSRRVVEDGGLTGIAPDQWQSVPFPGAVPFQDVAPVGPTGLKVTEGPSGRLFTLTWRQARDDDDNTGIIRYRVYRDGALIAETGGLSYTDEPTLDGQIKQYRVTAVDAAGNESTGNNTYLVVRDLVPPGPVSALRAQDIGRGRVTLVWDAPSGASGAVVVRDDGESRVVGGNGFFEDTPGGRFRYTVISRDDAGNLGPPRTVEVEVSAPGTLTPVSPGWTSSQPGTTTPVGPFMPAPAPAGPRGDVQAPDVRTAPGAGRLRFLAAGVIGRRLTGTVASTGNGRLVVRVTHDARTRVVRVAQVSGARRTRFAARVPRGRLTVRASLVPSEGTALTAAIVVRGR